jgi:hypothetical protein
MHTRVIFMGSKLVVMDILLFEKHKNCINVLIQLKKFTPRKSVEDAPTMIFYLKQLRTQIRVHKN